MDADFCGTRPPQRSFQRSPEVSPAVGGARDGLDGRSCGRGSAGPNQLLCPRRPPNATDTFPQFFPPTARNFPNTHMSASQRRSAKWRHKRSRNEDDQNAGSADDAIVRSVFPLLPRPNKQWTLRTPFCAAPHSSVVRPPWPKTCPLVHLETGYPRVPSFPGLTSNWL